MDLQVDDITLEQAVEVAMAHIRAGTLCRVVTPNGEFALTARKEPDFLEIINTSQLVLPDGISVVLASRIIGNPLGGKVAGIHFADRLCQAMGREGKRLYILGAKPGVAETAGEKLAEKHPGLIIAGTHHGYYEDEAAIVETIGAARADTLFVAMGAPRSERFMARYGDSLGVSVMAGIGGSVDVFAGNLSWTPDIFVRLGLEWFYRLIKEPRRIKRMIKLPLYLLQAVGYRLRHGRQGADS